jgi:hypothetical protein
MLMKKTLPLLMISTLGLLTVGLVPASAAMKQEASSQAQTETSAKHSWTMEQAVTSSVREAWALGGKTDEGFFQIVQALAELSAQKRGVTPPDTEAAGAKAGNWIRQQAKKDPDQLLYVVVDHAVQYSARHAGAGSS